MTPLPAWLYEYLQYFLDPSIAALSTLLIVSTFLVLAIANRLFALGRTHGAAQVSTTAREPPELEVRGLSKSFNGTAAVSDVSFVLGKGEFLSLLGPSGCGKTTILRMLAGFVAPDGGIVTLRNSDITLRPPYQRDVGLLFQNYALFPHMTVSENVGFGPRMRGMPSAKRAERVQWALDLVRLSGYGERKPSELSGGQQQRVAVARVLAAGASVLLLDEPFSNLDAKLRLHMQDELKELQLRLKIPTIHVTHDQEEAMSLSDRLIIMNAGRIEQNDRPEAVYRSPANKFVAEFMGSCTWLSDQAAILATANSISARPESYDCRRMARPPECAKCSCGPNMLMSRSPALAPSQIARTC